MSTGWNLECQDHPNAIHWLEEDWSGAGDHAGVQVAEVWRRRQVLFRIAELAPESGQLSAELEFAGYRRITSRMVLWAREHNGCRLELVNEYGHRRALDTLQPLPPRHCLTCTCGPQ